LRKKGSPLLLFMLFLLGCASLPLSPSLPERMQMLEGLGEIRVSLRHLKYEGQVSVKMEYPCRITATIYGPFGETEAFIKADESSFLFVLGEEVMEDREAFEKIFHVSLEGLLDAFLTGEEKGGLMRKRRGRDLCVLGEAGEICIRFSEVVALPS